MQVSSLCFVMAGLVPAISLRKALPALSGSPGLGAPRRTGDDEGKSAPDILGHFDDHGELCPLFVFGQDVALLGRGEAALRRQAQLTDVDEFRRFVDAAL